MKHPIRLIAAGSAVAVAASLGFAAVASADPASASKTIPHVYDFFNHTTGPERECLAKQGVTAPEGKMTDAQKDELAKKVQAAAAACKVTVNDKKASGRLAVGLARLTADQQACIAKIQVTRPLGKLTDEQKAKVHADLDAAIAACGVKPKG